MLHKLFFLAVALTVSSCDSSSSCYSFPPEYRYSPNPFIYGNTRFNRTYYPSCNYYSPWQNSGFYAPLLNR